MDNHTLIAETMAAGDNSRKRNLAALALAAIGVVFGDIGTSPLYALQTVFATGHGVDVNTGNLYGILSLVLWSLLLVVALKFVVFIMRADNHGEGGIMALMALIRRLLREDERVRNVLIMFGLFGAALFFGDGLITPAISVLSAMEGLEVAAPGFTPFVIPLSLLVLVGLFYIQSKGTSTVGALFGPVMVVWFVVIAVLGVLQIARAPQILQATNPVYAVEFLTGHGIQGFLALGAVVLTVTGAEALYADMGHFGPQPIRLSWFLLVLPALVLNYFGQGALMMLDHAAAANPFYAMAPKWALYPMVALSTAATVIASQAVISGVFSMTQQAIQLGFLPRTNVVHTSAREIGQIYVPSMNWMMMLGVVALILGFRSSANLGWAYG